jgi:hypothetical protein
MLSWGQLGFNRVPFQSGSQFLTNTISSSISGMSEFHVVIVNIRQLTKSTFNFEVKFIRGQINKGVTSYANRPLFHYAPHCIFSYFNEIN